MTPGHEGGRRLGAATTVAAEITPKPPTTDHMRARTAPNPRIFEARSAEIRIFRGRT